MNFRGVPEKFQNEWIFVYKQEKVVAGDMVLAMRNLEGTNIQKWTMYKIEKILISPNGNTRGFTKRLQLEWCPGEYNPKRFRKF